MRYQVSEYGDLSAKDLLVELVDLTVRLSSAKRDLGRLQAEQRRAFIHAWKKQPAKDAVTLRNRMAEIDSLPIDTEIDEVKGEIGAVTAEIELVKILLEREPDAGDPR